MKMIIILLSYVCIVVLSASGYAVEDANKKAEDDKMNALDKTVKIQDGIIKSQDRMIKALNEKIIAQDKTIKTMDEKKKGQDKKNDQRETPSLSIIAGGDLNANATANLQGGGTAGFKYVPEWYGVGSYMLAQFNYGVVQSISGDSKNMFGSSILNPQLNGYGCLLDIRQFIQSPKGYNVYARTIGGFSRYQWTTTNNVYKAAIAKILESNTNYAILLDDYLPTSVNIDIVYCKIGFELELFRRNYFDHKDVKHVYYLSLFLGYNARFFVGDINNKGGKMVEEICLRSRKGAFHGLLLRGTFSFEESAVYMEVSYLGIDKRKVIANITGVRLTVGMEAKINFLAPMYFVDKDEEKDDKKDKTNGDKKVL